MTNSSFASVSIPAISLRSLAAVSLSLLTALTVTACGSDEPTAQAGSDMSEAVEEMVAEAEDADAPEGDAPDACSLLTVDDIKAATGVTFDAGEGTDYDNTCRFNTSDDTVTVAISEYDDLGIAEPIGIDVVPVDGLPGATRVDAVVYTEVDGWYLSVATGLPGFNAPERDAAAAEELAKLAVSRF